MHHMLTQAHLDAQTVSNRTVSMPTDEEIEETTPSVWVADDEGALVRGYNERLAESDGFKTAQRGRTSDPTGDPRVDTSISTDVDEQPKEPPSPTRASACIGCVKDWWAERRLAQNKTFGLNPYVVVKMGRHGKEARTKAAVSSAGDPPEVYTNPKWTDEHGRDLKVKRSPNDRGELIVEVYDEGVQKDRFVGSCHVHLGEFIQHAETTKNWKHVLFHLYDQQELETGDESQRDAGGVHAMVRWVPKLTSEGTWAMDQNGRAKGVLKVKVLAGTDLRDVSILQVSDITSFADTSLFQLTFYLVTVFLVMSTLFYRYVVWGNLKEADGSTHGLDSVLFVITTFTTVGYGDHPELLETTFERLITVAFIISGMGILGVTIGTWGNMIAVKISLAKRRVREQLLKKLHHFGVSTSTSDASNDIREQVLQKLRKTFDEAKIDEHLIQTELGKVLVARFWRDEMNKLFYGSAGLAGILGLGTAVFIYTEQDACFVSEKTSENADKGCLVGQFDPTTGLENDGTEGRPMVGELISPGKTEQGLGVIDALYMTTVTASTVGYGDVTPQSWGGKLFAIVYIPIAVTLMSRAIMSIALIPMEYRRLKLETYVLDQFGDELSAPDLVELKSSVNIAAEAPIRKNDFTLAMLLRLGRLSKYDVTRIEQVFARLDKDNSGFLDKQDVRDLLALHARRMAMRPSLGAASSNRAKDDVASGNT